MDAYHRWLGIPPKDQPPNHYRLLAIEPFESSPDVIEAAADQRRAHLRTYQSGKHSELSQTLLNEVAASDKVIDAALSAQKYDLALELAERAKLEKRLEEVAKLTRPIPGLPVQQATPGKPFPRGRWVDVLKLVDPDKKQIWGTWSRQGEALATPVGEGGTFAIPVLVNGDYDLQWEFARTSNDYAVMCSFPVGPRRCRLALSLLSGKVHGLELIDGQNASLNPTGVRPGTLVNDRRYRVSLRVRTKGEDASIEAALEGKPLTRWSGSLTSLMAENVRTIELSGISSVIVYSVQLRLVSGTASLIQKPPRFELQRTLEGHEGGVTSVAFSLDGSLLASAGRDNTVKVWKTDTWELQRTLSGHTRPVLCLAFRPNGSTLASGSEDTTIQFWNVATGQVERTLKGHTGAVTSIAFSPDGTTLASTGAWDKTLRLWDAASGQQKQTVPGDERYMSAVAFSPKGNCLVAGHCGYPKVPLNYIRLWQLAALQGPQWSAEYVTNLAGLAFRPDGSVFACAGLDPTVTVWSVDTGKCVLRLEGHTDRLRCIAFRPDGLVLASGSQDQTIRLWTATGEAGEVLHGHTGFVRSVAFSPDGSLLASGSDDKTVKLWAAVKKD